MKNENAVAVHVPMDQMQRMAKSIVASRMFGCKTEDEALSIMLLAQAEGLHPATAARDYHVIQGRPAMKADAMLSRYLQSGGKVEWLVYTDAKVEGRFTHPQGGSVTIDWTPDRAKQAGLLGKDNWKHDTRQMLRARVISEGVRTTNPGVASGIYTVEEVQDMADTSHEARVERDMGAVEVVPDEAGGSAKPDSPATDVPADDALLVQAEEWASCGTDKYAAWWTGLTAEQRKTIGVARHEKLKATAAKA